MHWFAQIGGDDSFALTGMLGVSSACFDNDCVTCVWNILFDIDRIVAFDVLDATSKTETASQPVTKYLYV